VFRIATRGSTLALWQAHHVERALTEGETRLEIIRTTGDRITDVPLSQIGDRGLFTRELDAALLDGRADCAVHSLKDIPTLLPEGLQIGAILEREDPRDAWITRDTTASPESLPAGARVGTSSLRRRAILLATRPDLTVVDVRGNLDTRLEKLYRGDYDAMILALAGMRRLGRASEVTRLLDAPEWLPAPGQGAIAVVIRAGDDNARTRLAPLNHVATEKAVRAERALLRELEGGCQVPIGALARIDSDTIELTALVASIDGSVILRRTLAGSADDPETLGRNLAAEMIDAGADDILRTVRETSATHAPTVTSP
jgi:hydroxymethylbilane synthase